jgi:hypothetical protein
MLSLLNLKIIWAPRPHLDSEKQSKVGNRVFCVALSPMQLVHLHLCIILLPDQPRMRKANDKLIQILGFRLETLREMHVLQNERRSVGQSISVHFFPKSTSSLKWKKKKNNS